MNKLYEKSELCFALVWIGIYCVVQSSANPLNEIIGIKNSASAVFCIIQAAVLLLFMRKNGLLRKYGICSPSAPARQFLYFIPLFFLATGNLWNGIAANYDCLEMIFHIVLMICVGFLEEVIFRGFLFRAIAKSSAKEAIVISSVTFGIGHLLNLVNGSNMELTVNLFQVVGAIAFGFLFVILYYRGGSLLPCIVTHSAINILSAFSNEAALTTEKRIIFALIEFAIIAVYVLILTKTLPKRQTMDESGKTG